MKNFVLAIALALIGCGSAVKGPWETLPNKERFVYHHDYRCAEATRIVNGTKGWEVLTNKTVVSIDPKTGAHYTYRAVRKDRLWGSSWDQVAIIYEINYPGKSSIITHVWIPESRLPVMMDYHMLAEKNRTQEPDDLWALSRKATGKFFCSQRKVED